VRFTSKTSLAGALAVAREKLGQDAEAAVDAAVDAYVPVYDTSYKLKK
jgi:lipid-binding SYLF domain-containing protein